MGLAPVAPRFAFLPVASALGSALSSTTLQGAHRAATGGSTGTARAGAVQEFVGEASFADFGGSACMASFALQPPPGPKGSLVPLPQR